VPLVAVSVAVLGGVVVAQRSGGLEPLMFEASLLAFVVARRTPSPASAGGLGLVALACPVAVSVVQDPSEIAVGIWVLGIAFPWLGGLVLIKRHSRDPLVPPRLVANGNLATASAIAFMSTATFGCVLYR
jgi:hypothetical protein